MKKTLLILFTFSLSTAWCTTDFSEDLFSDPSMVEVEDVSLSSSGVVPVWETFDNTIGTYAAVGCSDCPTEISVYINSAVTWGVAAAYCRTLNQNSQTDWRMPTLDEAIYLTLVGTGPASAETIPNYNVSQGYWTSTKVGLIEGQVNQQTWYTYNINTGEKNKSTSNASSIRQLCVR